MNQRYHKIRKSNTVAITIFKDAYAISLRDASQESWSSIRKMGKWFSKAPKHKRDKKAIPLFARGVCDGPRLKENLKPPFLVILDVDKSPVTAAECHERLEFFEVNHVLHSTFSHGSPGEEGLHRYRVFVDYTAQTWEELEVITKQLFKLVGIKPTPESWQSPCFFAPAVHPERADLYKYYQFVCKGGSRWEPTWTKIKAKTRPEPVFNPQEFNRDEVRDALEHIPNDDRGEWIEIGMSLHSTGAEDAFELFCEWSEGQDYPDYNAEDCERVWDSFKEKGSGVGLGTVYYRARDNGWAPVKSNAKADFAKYRSPRQKMLAKLNDDYAFVWLGRGAIAVENGDSPVDFKSVQGFLDLYEHPRFGTGEFKKKKGETEPIETEMPLGKLWMKWSKRRSYHDVDFLPEGDLGPRTLNLWRGWPHEPRDESCRLFLEHIENVICNGDEELYRWVIAWSAHMVQRPWEKPQTALVLRSGEGTGKGIFFKTLMRLCGPYGVHITQAKQLTGNFNKHLSGRIFVFADEVTWGGRVQEEGVLKGLLTEEHFMVEPKGVDAFQTTNFLRVGIASNGRWVIPAGRTARRWQVIDVPEIMVGKRQYFDAIRHEIDNGGLNGLMRYLGGLDLKEWPNPMEITQTAALRDQKLESLDAIDQWVLSFLSNGKMNEFAEGWPKNKPISRSEFYDSYLTSAREIGVTRRAIEMIVANRLVDIFKDSIRLVRRSIDGKQARAVIFTELDECRERFETYMQSTIDW